MNKYISLHLVSGMSNKHIIRTLASGIENMSNVMTIVDAFKDDPENKKNYKIELYSRILFFDHYADMHGFIIDFGDYSTFLYIECDPAKPLPSLQSV